MENTINIQNFRGLVHFTHPGNLEGILREGLTNSTESSQIYRQSGQLKKHYGGKPELDFTIIGKGNSFEEWETIPWGHDSSRLSSIAAYCLLLDPTKMPPIHEYNIVERSGSIKKQLAQKELRIVSDLHDFGKNHPLQLKTKNNEKITFSLEECVDILKNYKIPFGFEIELVTQPRKLIALPPDCITGIIVSPYPAITRQRYFTNQNGELRRNDIIFNQDQNIKVGINRLNRLKRNSPHVYTPPIYDEKGSLFWSKEISGNEII
ncbi:hypothetical protein CL622_07930 [archaeon]|nr:hypothetical protein [archaeon]